VTEQTGELKFVEFKVLKEPWNEYKLEDGSTLMHASEQLATERLLTNDKHPFSTQNKQRAQ